MAVIVQSAGAGGGGSSGAGRGDSSTYSTSDDTERVTDENGKWDSIEYTDQLRYSGSETVIVGSADQDRLVSEFTLRNESSDVEYSVRLRIHRKPGGTYAKKDVKIVEYVPAGPNSDDKSLTASAADRAFNDDIHRGVNLLNPLIYTSAFDYSAGTFADFAEDITEMDSSSTTIVFAETTGRTDLTVQDRTLITSVGPNPRDPSALDTTTASSSRSTSGPRGHRGMATGR